MFLCGCMCLCMNRGNFKAPAVKHVTGTALKGPGMVRSMRASSHTSNCNKRMHIDAHVRARKHARTPPITCPCCPLLHTPSPSQSSTRPPLRPTHPLAQPISSPVVAARSALQCQTAAPSTPAPRQSAAMPGSIRAPCQSSWPGWCPLATGHPARLSRSWRKLRPPVPQTTT